jgi:prepilin-type N-terminal cleavage/methylation domain-containing protein
MRMTRRLRDTSGFTLVELLITMVVLGIIVGPLAGAMIVYLRNTGAVAQRLGESHDAQIAAAYFAQDVQSVGVRDWTAYPYPLKQSVERNVAATGGLYPCGAAGTPTALLRLAWDDPTSATDRRTVVVSYVQQTVDGEQQLRRITCAGSAAPDVVVLVHNVDTATAVSVTCSTTCEGTATVPVPATITLAFGVKDPADTGAALSVTLTGQRRQT